MTINKKRIVVLICFVLATISAWILYSELRQKEYILPNVSEGDYENFYSYFNNKEYCEIMGYDEEKHEVYVRANERQRRNWIQKTDEIINTFRNQDLMGLPLGMEVSLDRKTIVLNWSRDNSAWFPGGFLLNIVSAVEIYQVFNGISDWAVDILVYDRNTGDLVFQCNFPKEEFVLTPDMFSE